MARVRSGSARQQAVALQSRPPRPAPIPPPAWPQSRARTRSPTAPAPCPESPTAAPSHPAAPAPETAAPASATAHSIPELVLQLPFSPYIVIVIPTLTERKELMLCGRVRFLMWVRVSGPDRPSESSAGAPRYLLNSTISLPRANNTTLAIPINNPCSTTPGISLNSRARPSASGICPNRQSRM